MDSHFNFLFMLSPAPGTLAQKIPVAWMNEWIKAYNICPTEFSLSPLPLSPPLLHTHTHIHMHVCIHTHHILIHMGTSDFFANKHVPAFLQQHLTQLSHWTCSCLFALGHTYKQCSKKGHPCHDSLSQNRGNEIKQASSATHTQANKQTKCLKLCGIIVTVMS